MIELRPFDELPREDLGWLKPGATFPRPRKMIHREVAGAACVFGTTKRSRQTRALRCRCIPISRSSPMSVKVQSLTEIVSATKAESKRGTFRS